LEFDVIKSKTCWSVLIFGALIFILGLLGYIKGGSAASLYSGGSFGILLILAAIFMFRKKRNAFYAALFLTAALTLTFLIRYFVTAKQMPAILALLSGAMFLFLLTRAAHWKRIS
jgi:uncharacterized membrane protein (UPF0136 family)